VGAACVVLLGSASAAQAATWNVTTTADTSSGTCQPSSCSLRQAIGAASDGDTIALPASASAYQVINGPLDVEAAVTISGAGAGSTTISAEGSSRVMNIFSNTGAVTLRGLTITGGNGGGPSGGASTHGGGIAVAGPGPVILDGVTVTGNTVDDDTTDAFNLGGGGIFSTASLTLIDSTVSGNSATVTSSQGDGGGGGILMGQIPINGPNNSDDLTLRDSTVTGNSATVTADGTGVSDDNGGAGIYMDGGDLTITGSEITNNTATVATTPTNTSTPTDGGGGIFMFGNNFVLDDSTVSGNSADGPGLQKSGGGGVLDSGNHSTYVNDTVTGNTTDVPLAEFGDDDGGGGILLNSVQDGVVIANSTINANTAPNSEGGGINSQLTETTEITDSIVGGNSDSGSTGNCSGTVDSLGYNLTDDPASNDTCSFTATGDILNASPRLGTLADNGGPAQTEALEAGSPAITGGNPSGCTNLSGDAVITDERGALRPAGSACDIGAYQVALPKVQTGTALITSSAAVLSGTAADPDPRAASVVFQYGTTGSYGSTTSVQTLSGGSGVTTFTATLSRLAPGTYHFRIVAMGADGTTDGTDGVFYVAAQPRARPGVTTQRPLAVSATRATLLGAVNPESRDTTYHFVWGRRGRRITVQTKIRSIAASSTSRAVTATITKLRPNTRYAVRLTARNPAGKTIGSLVFFKTARRRRG
jgi:CSLREA domain-containing protein